jgi:hypothetical protein
MQNFDHNIEKNAKFFVENCQKLRKIVIITSTPGLGTSLIFKKLPKARDCRPIGGNSANLVTLLASENRLSEYLLQLSAFYEKFRRLGPMLSFFYFAEKNLRKFWHYLTQNTAS